MQDSLLSYIRADSMMRSIYATVVLAQIWLSRLARREASMSRPCLHGHDRAKELGLAPSSQFLRLNLLLLAAVLGGDILILVVIGEVRTEKVRVRTVVLCNKIKCLGLVGEERCFDGLATRI